MHTLRRMSLLAMLVGLFAMVGGTVPVAAAIPDSAPDAPTTLFFPQTKQVVGGAFLKYWTNNGGLTRLGFPVSSETQYKDRAGKSWTVQYFERARMEYHPENAGTPYEVLLGQLGKELAGGRTDAPFAPVPQSAKNGLNDDGALWFKETQQTLANGFRLYWQANGGLPIFGYPISQEFTEKNPDDGNTYTVQYFERARMEWHPEIKGGSVLIGLMGKASAQQAKVDLSPRAQGNLPAWAPNFGEKWIEVILSQQRLNAKVGSSTVWSTLVSTGKPATPTPVGEYRVYAKLVTDDMTGGLAGSADYYYLPDVPNVMYFLAGGYAIHGTYWHNNFGTVQSRGCVNVPLAEAKALFDWAPMGVRVVIRD